MLTEEETYKHLLQEKSAVYCLDDKILNFVLQDFDGTKNQLKVNAMLMLGTIVLRSTLDISVFTFNLFYSIFYNHFVLQTI